MNKRKMPASRLLFNDNSLCDTGRLTAAGILSQQRPSGFRKMRVLGSYALVCLTAGGGYYRDVNGISQDVNAGNALLIFPEIAHRYGPRLGQSWSEIYVVFDGSIFDQLRKSTFLNDRHPVLQMSPALAEELEELVKMPRPLGMAQRIEEIGRFLELLGKLYRANEGESTFGAAPAERWLPQAKRLLEANLEQPVDWEVIARQCGMSYESFRKKFRASTGISPARYRDECRIQAACMMLTQHPQLTLRQVAHSLGFYDEFAFSKRFKQVKNCSPREWRKQGAAEK